MDKDKIKCVIVDFDNTLYSGADDSKSNDYYLKFMKDLKLVENEEEFEKIQRKYPKFHRIQTMFAFLRENNLDTDKLRDYLNDNILEVYGDKIRFIDNKILKEISKKYKLYLLSDSSVKYITFNLKAGNIDKDNFVECISNDYTSEDLSKKESMKRIMEKENCKAEEIVMVGDSYQFDIVPATALGFNVVHVRTVEDTTEFLESLLK